jgi:hypothetical protein
MGASTIGPPGGLPRLRFFGGERERERERERDLERPRCLYGGFSLPRKASLWPALNLHLLPNRHLPVRDQFLQITCVGC